MYGQSLSLKACARTEVAQVPFLYCTRTILGSCLYSKWIPCNQHHLYPYSETHRSISSEAAQEATSKPRAKPPKQDGSDGSNVRTARSGSKSFLVRKRDSLIGTPIKTISEPPSYLLRSTITNTERATFSKIFRDLIEDSAGPTISRLTSEEIERRDTAAQEAKELKALSDTILPIYREAIEDYETRRKVQENHQNVLPSRLMERLPQSLQKEAEQSNFFFNKDRIPMRRQKGERTKEDYFARAEPFAEHPQREQAKGKRAETTISISQVVQEMCLRELEETAFRCSQVIRMPDGDLKIWEICEDRIFSLVRLLEPSQNASTLTSKASKKPTLRPTQPPTLKVPKYIPPLAVVSRLYPTSINLAVNLLVKNFPTSLILPNFLPHIKSLGQISYVLGASRKLYNRLLNHYWRDYSDVIGMDRLLTEMLDSGIGFDKYTLQILHAVRGRRQRELGPTGEQSRERSKAIAHEKGLGQDKRPYAERARSDAWWNLEPIRNCVERLSSFWQDVVSQSIVEMQQTSEDEKKIEEERKALEAKTQPVQVLHLRGGSDDVEQSPTAAAAA